MFCGSILGSHYSGKLPNGAVAMRLVKGDTRSSDCCSFEPGFLRISNLEGFCGGWRKGFMPV